MAISSLVHARLNWLINGETGSTSLTWAAEDEHPTISSEAVANAAYDTVWGAIKSLMCEAVTLRSISAYYTDSTNGSKPAFLLQVNEPGEVVGSDMVPPYVTVNIMKLPDNSTIEPPGAPPFKVGFNGFPGFPENAQANGIIDEFARGVWNGVGEAYEEMDVDDGGTPVTYMLAMWRDPEVGDDHYVYVGETYLNIYLGSRNSRKYRG